MGLKYFALYAVPVKGAPTLPSCIMYVTLIKKKQLHDVFLISLDGGNIWLRHAVFYSPLIIEILYVERWNSALRFSLTFLK